VTIRVVLNSERAISRDPATVEVYDGDRLVSRVTVRMVHEQGADGGWYSVAKLEG
jgi:hypothetical protein